MTAVTSAHVLSFADIVAAALLPTDFTLPLKVRHLSRHHQKQLLGDCLTPVLYGSTLHQPQRALFKWFSEQSYSHHLRTYCRYTLILKPAAWDFIARAGKPNHVKVPAAVKNGTITDMDGPAITSLYVHWVELQRHVGLSEHVAARVKQQS